MNTADILIIKTAVSMTELRRNPRKIIRVAEDFPVAVLSRKKPHFYLFSAKVYEALLKSIDNALLTETIKTRREPKSKKVKIKSYY
jgi:antitoxin StbD